MEFYWCSSEIEGVMNFQLNTWVIFHPQCVVEVNWLEVQKWHNFSQNFSFLQILKLQVILSILQLTDFWFVQGSR